MANGDNDLTSGLPPITPSDGGPDLSVSPNVRNLLLSPLPTGTSPSSAAPSLAASSGFDIALGDSLAAQQHNHGMWGNTGPQYNSRDPAPFNVWDTNAVGDPTSRTLARTQYLLNANPDYFRGKNIFLSAVTNSPNDMTSYGQLLDLLKGAGAANVVAPGVGPGVSNQAAVNAAVQKQLEARGFTYFDPNMTHGWDRAQQIHPNYPPEMTAQAMAALHQSQSSATGAPPPTTNVARDASGNLVPVPAGYGMNVDMSRLPQVPDYSFDPNARNVFFPNYRATASPSVAPNLSTGLQAPGEASIPYATYGGTPANQQRAADLALLNKTIYQRETSSGRNVHTSTAGAVGPMQIMPSTWKQYAQPGEDINNYQDNMRVGQRIIADLYDRYGGNMDAVLIGYNAGEAHIGGSWQSLRPETQNYILASHKDWGIPATYTPYTGQAGPRMGQPPMVSGQRVAGTNYGMGAPLAFAPPTPMFTGPTAPTRVAAGGGPTVNTEAGTGGAGGPAGGPSGSNDSRIQAINRAFQSEAQQRQQGLRGFSTLALLGAMMRGTPIVRSGYNPARVAAPPTPPITMPMNARIESPYIGRKVLGGLWY